MLKKKAAEDSSINNGQQVAAVEEDPLVILKQLFKTKEYGPKILDKNRIANKYRLKYVEDMKKEKNRQQVKLQKQFKEDERLTADIKSNSIQLSDI